jgi:hypothetical protein
MIVSLCSPLFILIMYFSFVLYPHAALLVGWSWDWFPVLSLDFSVTYSFWPNNGPGVDSGPNENEYQEHFLGVKAASAWGWPHHLRVWNVMKSGSLNLLETSGPHQALCVTALLYPQSHWWPISRMLPYKNATDVSYLSHLSCHDVDSG